jgi:hypothetical protein
LEEIVLVSVEVEEHYDRQSTVPDVRVTHLPEDAAGDGSQSQR